MSDARISTLFLLWTAVGVVAEVPAGALADRFSRRSALAVGGVFQAVAYGLWVVAPSYGAFAAGFVVWGLGGALASGALEALLYDNLAAIGAEAQYPRIYGRVTAVGLLCQLPTAAAATLLFASGGYPLVGWASVACSLAAAAVATRLPESRPELTIATGLRESRPEPTVAAGMPELRRAANVATRPNESRSEPTVADGEAAGEEGGDLDEPGYLTLLRRGVIEAAGNPAVRAAVVAVAILSGLDGIEEYFPLLAHDWGIGSAAVPLAVVAIPLAGAAGAGLGGGAGADRLRPRTLALILAASVGVLCAAALVHRPAAVAGIAVSYGLYQLVLVVTNARLQATIEGPSRATVTSVASLGTELSAAVLLTAWALGRPWLMAGVALAVAGALPRLLGRHGRHLRPPGPLPDPDADAVPS